MSRRTRIVSWAGLALCLLVPLGIAATLRGLVGRPAHAPSELATALSPAAHELVERAIAEFRTAPAFDHHVHVAGVGPASGCRVDPRMRSWLHPKLHVQFLAYMQAAGVTDMDRADDQYAARLFELAREPAISRYGLLAFDEHYAADGRLMEEGTDLYVPLEHVRSLSAAHPDLFVPVASVHPYRADVLAQLELAVRAGARMVKWLPNSMGIDPADPRCDGFYTAMSHLGLVLLSHGGEELAVDAAGAQELGNPLRLRRALEHGVTVIVAHCAAAGTAIDLDDPAHTERPTFDLFLRMMDDPRWVGRLYGEISTITQYNRCGRPLETLLARTDLFERLVNGSDYPLPAIDVLFRTKQLAGLGYLTQDEARLLDEVWDVNPLLFDFVVKRTVHHPKTGARFPASVFRDRLGIAR